MAWLGIPQWSYDTTGCPTGLSWDSPVGIRVLPFRDTQNLGFSMVFLSMFRFNQSWHVLKVEFLKDWMGPYSWPGIEDYRKKPERIRVPHIRMPLVKDHSHQNTHVGDNNYQQSTYRLPLFSYTLQAAQAGLIYHQSWMTTWCLPCFHRPLKRPCWSIWTDGNTSGESAPASSSTRISPTQHLVIGSIGDQMICVRNAFSVCSTVCTNSSSSPSSSCSCWWWWRRCWWKRSWKPAPD